jgi:hypothetical protein
MSGFKAVTAHAIEARSRATDLHIGFGGHILLGGLLPVTDCEPPNSGASGGTRREAFPEMLFAPGIINGPTGRRIGR